MKDILISLITYAYIGRIMLTAHEMHTDRPNIYIFNTMKLTGMGDKMIYIAGWPIMLIIHASITTVLSVMTDIKMISLMCYEISSLIVDGSKKEET